MNNVNRNDLFGCIYAKLYVSFQSVGIEEMLWGIIFSSFGRLHHQKKRRLYEVYMKRKIWNLLVSKSRKDTQWRVVLFCFTQLIETPHHNKSIQSSLHSKLLHPLEPQIVRKVQEIIDRKIRIYLIKLFDHYGKIVQKFQNFR